MKWRQAHRLALIAIVTTPALFVVATDQAEQDCLFVNYSNGKAVAPCGDSDPLRISYDQDLRKVMTSLGITPSQVRFKGCSNLEFSVIKDPLIKGPKQYLISYPLEARDSYLAPVVHELAHVMQVNSAGGDIKAMREQRDSSSLRIELEADYLTGMVLSRTIATRNLALFQHNIVLTGMYKEENYRAHGTPAQRTSAFRMGYFQPIDANVPDLVSAPRYFQENVYDGLARAR
ncbi:hypothetical protein [Pseudoxanthomonas mexicana]|uniref:hypothetical protein n=1 Tax=Pseudoxanthomonas mexicana TaxID=128785 RepID=UPI0028A9574E|nr:hypothetical protein [Pseudoxanthomonas mexicana]